jgi:hypothetical protein
VIHVHRCGSVVQPDVDPMMTSTVAERPAHYDAPKHEAVTTASRPMSPMNTIGEGATPLMYACQQSRDQDVRNILAKKVTIRERKKINGFITNYNVRTGMAQLVEALRYKPEGRGFDSRWCHWNFSLK